MKIENIGNGYLRVTFDHEGILQEKIIDKMRHIECFLPFQKDTEKKQSMIYHTGNYIPLVEYLNKKTLELEETKGIFLSVIDSFERIDMEGLMSANVITALYHVYVDPVTQEIRFIYCPVDYEVDIEGFPFMMKELIFSIKTSSAELLLGTVVEQIVNNGKRERDYQLWKKRIQGIRDNVQIIEKKVEVDRILERTIERTVERRQNFLPYLIVYDLVSFCLLVGAPTILSARYEIQGVSKPEIINILLFIFDILISSCIVILLGRKKQNDRTIVTTEPRKKQEIDG